MTHLEGTLGIPRLPQRVAPPQELHYTAESDVLLETVENALFSEASHEVRFASPLKGSGAIERSLLQHRELARPIVSPWQKAFKTVRYGLLAGMIGYGGFLGYNLWYGPLGGSETVAAQVVGQYRPARADEAAVTKQMVQQYEVAASQPKRLQLAGQDIHARIQAQGMTDGAELLAAKNSNDVSWYNGSATPGRSGVTVLVGALAGPTKPTNFARAGKTAVGDKVTVTMGDDSAIFFHVTSVTTVPTIGDMSAFLSQGVGPETLKLVLRDKMTKTNDTGSSSLVIVGERFQDPQPKYKNIRRW